MSTYDYSNAKALLDDADAVLISASNGLSISEGYNIFANDENFRKRFGDFEQRFSIHNIIQGVLTPLDQKDREEFQKRLHKYIVEEYQPDRAFQELKKLIGKKEYFILTSNGDTHFQLNGFDPAKIWEIEGNFFGNKPKSDEWTRQAERYRTFMNTFASRKVVQLELGIGRQNQMLKAPLMDMVRELPQWTYITLNLDKELYISPSIRNKSVALAGDITESLQKLNKVQGNPDFVKRVRESKPPFNYEDLVMEAQMNYSRYYQIYARGSTVFPLSRKAAPPYEESIRIFAEKIKEADHIVIGGASGLSAAGGGDFYYTDSPSFYQYFGKFAKKYHFRGAFAGMRYPWKTREEYWGYLAAFLHTTLTAPIRTPYLDLQKIIKGKDFFVVTTNQDTQAIKAFPENRVAELQGDHRYFQCSRQCTDAVWDAVKPVQQMIDAMGSGTSVPKELIPRCPWCGAEAFPWVRGYGNFLQGTKYQEEYQKASSYISHLGPEDKVLFLELGVGRLTPMFIQEPFWMLTAAFPNAYDIMVNLDYQFLPETIENKGLAIRADIGKVLNDVVKILQK